MVEGPGLLQVAREKMRTRHLAYRTEQTVLQWMRRYVRFHRPRHPRELRGGRRAILDPSGGPPQGESWLPEALA